MGYGFQGQGQIEHEIQSTGSAEEIKADVMGKVASLRIPFPKTL